MKMTDAATRGEEAGESGAPSSNSGVVQVAVVEPVRFGDYWLVAKLGHGGMAEVYLGLTEGAGGFRKLLVVKTLHKHMLDDAGMVRMFLDEAKLAARLNHPHVVQTLQVGSFEGQPFLAMEYLEGQPVSALLKACVARGIRLAPELAATIAVEALDGLHYAHEAQDFDGTPIGIVHRDVSPHNLFVTYAGQVKVLDFGIAKTALQSTQTATGFIKGKFAYIAPEQARAEGIDRRADIWSMGVVLWELIAQRRLFRGDSDAAVLAATLSAPIPRLTDVVSGLDPALDAIVQRALSRDREQRWPTAADMRDALVEWKAGRTPSAPKQVLSDLLKTLFQDEIAARRKVIQAAIRQIDAGAKNWSSPAGERGGRLDGAADTTGSRTPLPLAVAQDLVATRAERVRPRRLPSWVWVGAGLAVVGVLSVAGWLVMSPRANDSTGATPPAGGGSDREASVFHAARAAGETSEASRALPRSLAAEDDADPLDAGMSSSGVQSLAGVEGPSAGTDSSITVPPRPTAPDARVPGRAAGAARAKSPSARGAANPTPSVSATPTPPAGPGRGEPPSAAPSSTAPTVETGRLRLDAVPFAVATWQGRRLGVTPIDVELPAGVHTIVLRNPESGVELNYRVTVTAGAVVSRRVALE
jgi:serine/threonine-protein kinase